MKGEKLQSLNVVEVGDANKLRGAGQAVDANWRAAVLERNSAGTLFEFEQCPMRATAGAMLQGESENSRKELRDLLEASPSEITVAEFVEARFVPEHVARKRLAGLAHYQAILKHILTPEKVDQIFRHNAVPSISKRKAIQGWPYLDDLLLQETQPIHLQKLLAAALAQGYSTQTIAHIRNVVSVIFTHARKMRCYAGKNPAYSVKLTEVTHKSVPALTLDQVSRLLGRVHYPEKEMILIAMLTDLNVAEICGLQWKHVNLTGKWSNGGNVPVPPITLAVQKQCYRGRLINVRDNRLRNIPIPELLLPMFLKLSGRAEFNGLDDFVLVSRAGTPVNAINLTARRLKSIGREMQLPWLSWLVFRRSHKTLHSQLGSEFEIQMARMVHSNSMQDLSTE
jgi:integrase